MKAIAKTWHVCDKYKEGKNKAGERGKIICGEKEVDILTTVASGRLTDEKVTFK